MKPTAKLFVVISVILIASCGRQTNTVKVLDATICLSDNCPSKERRWTECLSRGFLEKLPENSNVVSARDFNELIEYKFSLGSIDKKIYKESINAQGMVFDEEIGSTPKEVNSTAKQYCSGSEYILEG